MEDQRRVVVRPSGAFVGISIEDRGCFAQRMRELMEFHGIETEVQLARELGLSRSTVYHWFSADCDKPRLDTLQLIALTFPHVSLRWLVLGEGEMLDGR